MDWLKTSKNSLQDGVKKFRNKDLMEAIAAGCAVVAAADGQVTAEEKQKMAAYIGRNEDLKVFNMNDVIGRFNHYVGGFEFDYVVGKNEAFKPIAKFQSKPEVGRIIVGVCCAIGAADGEFDTTEKDVVREMCAVLGLDASQFQL